jgi:DNA-binding CsgD family transcriptional regulator
MSAQIFGRDAEQQAIGGFLDAVGQAAGALVLAGSAGSGKTTLLRAAADLARARGYTVLATTPARSDMRLAFAGLADLLEPCLDAVISELPGLQARALRVALLIADAPAHPPEPRQIATAFRTALTVLARSAPVLVVVDDVQWLDPPSETAVSYAVRRMAAEQVGLICAQRTDKPGAELPLELGRARIEAGLMPVGGLSIGALHRLLRTRLGASFSQPTLRRIETESGGNPFIALELGRALARRGDTSTHLSALPVPDTLNGLIGERISELPRSVLDALQLVAVMPRMPAEKYVAASAAQSALDAAVLAGVLEPDGLHLRFAHPLLGAAVAATIPAGRRPVLHGLAAAVADDPEDRARHQALAAAGPSAAVAADLETAAAAAVHRGAPATAAELFELAASLTPADEQSAAIRRTASAARQLALAGSKREAVRLLRQTAAAAAPGPERADALYQLGWIVQDDSVDEAAAVLEQALAEADDDPGRAAYIHLALCDIASKRADEPRASVEARKARTAAELSGDQAAIALALANFVMKTFQDGQGLDDRLLERALALESEIGGGRLAESYSPSWVAGYCHLVDGNLDVAETRLRQFLRTCDTEGLEYWRGDVLLRLSLLATYRGDLGQAAELAELGLQTTEQADQPQTIAANLYVGAEAAVHLGQVEAARDLAERGMAMAAQAGDSPYFMRNSGVLGLVDLAVGDYRAAAARLGPLAQQWRQMGTKILTTNGIEPNAVEALVAVGELDAAAKLIAEMASSARGPLAEAIVARCRGELAAGRGDPDAAVAELTEALRLFGLVSPQPLTRARTLLALGGVQRRRKQRAAARATLGEALSLLEGIGAPLWAARTRAELARISGRTSGPEDLTATERRVADLVASGRTNKEVAAELFVSVRAVESTLTKAYAKLGVRSRTELAARLGPAAVAPPRPPGH